MYKKLLLSTILLSTITTSVYSMEEELSKFSPSVKAAMVKNENQFTFSHLPLDLKSKILQFSAYDKGYQNKYLSSLAVVCKNWANIISDKNTNIKKSWFEGIYKIENPQDKAAFDIFYNGKLIYKGFSVEANSLGLSQETIFAISDLKNPLDGKFDLSKCKEPEELKIIEKVLTISTGYDPEKGYNTEADKYKMKVQIVPHFLSPSVGWDENIPIGIFWTFNDTENSYFLIKNSPQTISHMNLYKNWKEADYIPPPKTVETMGRVPLSKLEVFRDVLEKFQFSF